MAVIVVLGSVLFMPVSVAIDVSFHEVPSSCKAGDVIEVVVAFGEGVTVLVHPAAATVESNDMLIKKTSTLFFIKSGSPRQEIELV